MTMEALPQDLADFLVTRNFDPEYFNDKGQPTEAGEAATIKFDYVADSGKNYGTAVCVIADNELSLFYGDNLGRGMEQEDKQDWFSFLEQLSNTAASHSATWSPRDINQLKHTLAGIAAIKEGLFEGYYGTKKISYMGEQTQARLVIKHNRVLGEDDKRYRYVESLFIETAEQERFRLPFKSLSAGRAMLEHVRSGGNPYDVRGNHITEIVSEMAVLSRFNRAQHHRVFEGVTQELVESAQQYYRNLQETVKHLGSPRGYQAYFESWAPDQTGQAEALVENLRDLFVEQTLDARIEAALPTLAKIQQQGNNMKEAQIFENWVDQISEGTWSLPDTPEAQEKLNQLMASELIVGPDATNATEQLYDIVGDDELFDILNDLADKSQGRANIWDDSDVQRRLAELGIQTPQSTQAEPADVGQDTAPELNEEGEISMSNPGQLGNQEYKDSLNQRYGQPDLDTSRMNKQHQDFYDKNPSFKQSGKEIVSTGDGRLASKVVPAVTDTKVGRIPMNTFGDKQSSKSNVPTFLKKDTSVPGMEKLKGPVDVMTDPLNMMPKSPKWPERTHENADLARMLRHAGVTLNEDANWKDIDDRSAPVKGANQKIKTIEPGSAIRVDPNYKNPGIAPSPKSNGMGRIVQGTWQADPKGTVKAPSGDPEGVQEDDADPFNDPFFNSKSKPEAETFTQLQQQNAQGKGTSLKTMNPIDRDQYLKNTGRTWDATTQRSVPAVKTTPEGVQEDDADPFANDPFFNTKSQPEPVVRAQQKTDLAQGKGTSLKDMNPIDRDQYLKNTGNRTWDEKTQRSVPAVKTNEDEEFNRMLTLAGMHIKEANETVPSINQTNANIRGKIAPPNQIAAPTVASIIGNSAPVQASKPTSTTTTAAPTVASIIGNSAPVQASKPTSTTTTAAPAATTPSYKADVAFGQGKPAAAPAAPAAANSNAQPAATTPSYKADVAFGQGKPAAAPAAPTTTPAANTETNVVAEETDKDFAYILKHAGLPIKEGVLTDSTGSTLDHIIDTYKRDVKDFEQIGEMSRHLEQVLYDYYYDDMPYGAKTGEDIDTSEWISDRFAEDLGINENLISPMIMPVSEGSCNMTMEGEYCPEHGLAECGGMSYGMDEGMSRLKELAGVETHPVQAPTDIQDTDLDPAPFGGSGGGIGPFGGSGIGNLTHDDSDTPFKVDIDGFGPEPDDLGPQMGSSQMASPRGHEVDEGVNFKPQQGDALLARIKSLALLR